MKFISYNYKYYYCEICQIMRPSESEQAKSPEGGLKSNKNITSAVTFNLKTENDHRGGE